MSDELEQARIAFADAMVAFQLNPTRETALAYMFAGEAFHNIQAPERIRRDIAIAREEIARASAGGGDRQGDYEAQHIRDVLGDPRVGVGSTALPETFGIAPTPVAPEAGGETPIGPRIRLAREAKGWTLEDLATRAEVPRATISRIETEHNDAGFSVVMRLVSTLGISIDDKALRASEARLAEVEGEREGQRARADLGWRGRREAEAEAARLRTAAERAKDVLAPSRQYDAYVPQSGEVMLLEIREAYAILTAALTSPETSKGGDSDTGRTQAERADIAQPRSSDGSEHLPSKQEVAGSSPAAAATDPPARGEDTSVPAPDYEDSAVDQIATEAGDFAVLNYPSRGPQYQAALHGFIAGAALHVPEPAPAPDLTKVREALEAALWNLPHGYTSRKTVEAALASLREPSNA